MREIQQQVDLLQKQVDGYDPSYFATLKEALGSGIFFIAVAIFWFGLSWLPLFSSPSLLKTKSKMTLSKKTMLAARKVFAFTLLLCFFPSTDARINKEPLAVGHAERFTLDKGMKQLKEISRRLRGRGSEGGDSAGTMMRLKDHAKSFSSSLQTIQMHYQAGDNEGAGAALQDAMGDMKSFVKTSKETKNIAAIDRLPDSFDEISDSDLLSHVDVPNSLHIGDFAQKFGIDELAEFSKDFADSLDLSIASLSKHTGNLPHKSVNDNKPFKFGDVQFDQSFSFSNVANGGHYEFFNQPTLKSLHRKVKSAGSKGLLLPKLSNFLPHPHHEIVMAKHQVRRNALGNEICGPRCSVTDTTCNCEKLFGCIQNMTAYDLAVLTAGGYIETTEGSAQYGTFSVQVNDLNLFGINHAITQKLQSIKQLVGETSSSDEDQCTAILKEFYSACNPAETSCSQTNQQSFPVTAEEVCAAVNTRTKLNFEAIGDKLDGFVDSFGQTECIPLSYDTCKEFVVAFDLLYEGRNTTIYPHRNPMIKSPNETSLQQYSEDNKVLFDNTQLPIGYTFPEDKDTGVFTRTFQEAAFFGHPTLHDKAFSLVNPNTGMALALRGSDCNEDADMRLIQLKDVETNRHQQFKLTPEDYLESVGCPGKVITTMPLGTNNFQCREGVGLVLMTPYQDESATQQKWRFYDNGGIVNVHCGRLNGNLAISAIEDNSLGRIPFLGHSTFSIINPSTGMAIGAASATPTDFGSTTSSSLGQLDAPLPSMAAREVTAGDDENVLSFLSDDCTKCTGDYACSGTGTVECGSCNGNFACSNNPGPVGNNACNGQAACMDLNEGSAIGDGSCNVVHDPTGEHSSQSACSGVSSAIGEDSCNYGGACIEAKGHIGSHSCNSFAACMEITGTVGDNACIGENSCARSSGTISNGSCKGNSACLEISGTILEGSCKGYRACAETSGHIGVNACGEREACSGSHADIPNGCPSISEFNAGNCGCGDHGCYCALDTDCDISICLGNGRCGPNGCPSHTAYNDRECGCGEVGCFCEFDGDCENGSVCFLGQCGGFRNIELQNYDGSLGQRFNFSPVAESADGVFMITSAESPNMAIDCTEDGSLLLTMNSPTQDVRRKQWKIGRDGTIENVACNMVIDILDPNDPTTRTVRLQDKLSDGGWNQIWTIASNDATLLVAGDNSTQMWSPTFGTGYDLALRPGFPGDMETPQDKAEPFSLANPTTGMALGVSDSAGCENMILLVENHSRGSSGQMFRLVGDDKIESVMCPGQYLTNQCTTGTAIRLQPDGAAGQKWRLNGDGTISNKECTDLAISPIQHNLKEYDSLEAAFVNAETGLSISPMVPITLAGLPNQCVHSGRLYAVNHEKVNFLSLFKLQKVDADSSDFTVFSVGCDDTQIHAGENCPGQGVRAQWTGDSRFVPSRSNVHWRFGDNGSIRSATCIPQVISAHNVDSYDRIRLESADGSMLARNQQWTTPNAIMMEKTSALFNPEQEFRLELCLTSTHDRQLAKSAMSDCDESMSLLVGSQMSVGTLKAIADLVNERGSESMPGECCMDVATNSEFFGYNYDPTKMNDVTNTSMKCQYTGPWHLGISEEACENAGGDWFRNPCITLKDCIDSRPPRFDMDDPMDGSCQDALNRLDTAFVSVSTDHAEFKNLKFESSQIGCLHFCQRMPNYESQTGMVVKHETPRSVDGDITDAKSCTCLYENDALPPKQLFPNYTTPSLSKFSLTNSLGMALGLRPGSDCNEDELSIETQVSHTNSPHQQFLHTQDGRIVSVRCPTKVLTTVLENDSCSSGVGLKASRAIFPSLPTDAPAECGGEFGCSCMVTSDCNDGLCINGHCSALSSLQQWTFNSDGRITNVGCSDLAISSLKKRNFRLDSIYFALQNPRTQLAMAVIGSADDCRAGMPIQIQQLVYGIPNQQFIYDENERKIVSVFCPGYAIEIPNGDCDTTDGLHLSNRDDTEDDARDQWSFRNGSSIESIKCQGKFITIDGASSGGARTETGLTNFAKISANSLTSSPITESVENSWPDFDQDSESNRTNHTSPANYSSVQNFTNSAWQNNIPPSDGSSVILSSLSTERYQVWTQKRQHFDPLMGPFSLVNPTNRLAIGVEEGMCANGIRLVSQMDDHNSTRQQFYLGKHGSVFSSVCPGMVISVDAGNPDVADFDTTIKLETFRLGETNSKWKFKDGTIQSVNHTGMVMANDGVGTVMTLQSNATADPSQSWRRVNTRLLDLSIVGPTDTPTAPPTVAPTDLPTVPPPKNPSTEPPTVAPTVSVPATGNVCEGICKGEFNYNNPYGCAWDLPGNSMYGCHPEGGCFYIPQNGDNYPYPGFCTYRRVNGAQTTHLPKGPLIGHTVNTMSDPPSDNQETWKQDWVVSFVEPEPVDIPDIDGGITTCFKPSDAFSASFDDFAKEFAIDDASDEEQCRRAREELGFDKDHSFDVDICQSFRRHMCDPFFTGVDHSAEQITGPPRFEMIEYRPVEYEEVEYKEVEYEGVGFETIDYEEFTRGDDGPPFRTDEWPEQYGNIKVISEDPKHEEYLNDLQDMWLHQGNLLTAAEHFYDNTVLLTEGACGLLPGNVCVGVACVWNPARTSCNIGVLAVIATSYSILVAATLAYSQINRKYEKETLGPDLAIYGYEYSQATYLNAKIHNEWNKEALEGIRSNMRGQHEEMKRQLQLRHRDIANHVGQDVADAQNALGSAIVEAQNSLGQAIVDSQNSLGQAIIDTQNALGNDVIDAQNANGQAIVDAQNAISTQHNILGSWIHRNLCVMFNRLEGEGGCEDFIGPLEEHQTFIPVEFHWLDGQPSMAERLDQIQSALSIGEKNYAGDSKTISAHSLLEEGTKAQDLEAIKEKVDLIKADVQVGVHAVEDKVNAVEGKVDAVEGKVDAVEVKVDAVEGKVDAVEGKVDAVEAKVDAVEDKVDAVEGKVDAVQQELKDVKIMMSKLLELNRKLMDTFSKE